MESLSSSEAASMLFQQYGDEVYRYIRFTVQDPSLAEDLLQEVFLRVIQSWVRFRHESSPKTWLWSITNHCLREHFRKQKRTSDHLLFEDKAVTEMMNKTNGDSTTEVSHDHLMMLELEQSLHHLAASQKQVFIERIINEKSTAETALTLGLSESMVKTTLHRAVKKVRKLLRESWKGDETRG